MFVSCMDRGTVFHNDLKARWARWRISPPLQQNRLLQKDQMVKWRYAWPPINRGCPCSICCQRNMYKSEESICRFRAVLMQSGTPISTMNWWTATLFWKWFGIRMLGQSGIAFWCRIKMESENGCRPISTITPAISRSGAWRIPSWIISEKSWKTIRFSHFPVCFVCVRAWNFHGARRLNLMRWFVPWR